MSTQVILPALPSASAAFNYAGMNSTEVAALRAQAARIRKLDLTLTQTVIELGRELIDVKARLQHGQFEAWVEAECGFTSRTANYYMSAAKFAEDQEGNRKRVSDLPPGVVYQLASQSTPPEIVNEVLDRAAKGDIVKPAELKAKIRQVKGRHTITRISKKGRPYQVLDPVEAKKRVESLARLVKSHLQDEATKTKPAISKPATATEIVGTAPLTDAKVETKSEPEAAPRNEPAYKLRQGIMKRQIDELTHKVAELQHRNAHLEEQLAAAEAGGVDARDIERRIRQLVDAFNSWDAWPAKRWSSKAARKRCSEAFADIRRSLVTIRTEYDAQLKMMEKAQGDQAEATAPEDKPKRGQEAKDRATAALLDDPTLTRRGLQEKANVSAKCAHQVRHELDAAGKIPTKEAAIEAANAQAVA
jgi:Protein of unknown function (DUF3102)